MEHKNISSNKSKMYILIRDDVDLGHAILSASHASLSGYLTFVESDLKMGNLYLNSIYGATITKTEFWAKESFRKVVCKVSIDEFEKAKTYGINMKDYRIMVESGLGGMEVAIVFKPRDNFEPFFKSLKLYK
jgi:peptidyl-tRNA hydrolase